MLWHIQWGKYFASPRQEEHSSMTSVDADHKCQTRRMQWAIWGGSDLYMVYSFWFHFVTHHLPNILNSSFLMMNSLGVDISTKIEKFFKFFINKISLRLNLNYTWPMGTWVTKTIPYKKKLNEVFKTKIIASMVKSVLGEQCAK